MPDDRDAALRAEVCLELTALADAASAHAERLSMLLAGWNPISGPPDNTAASLAGCATTLGEVADVAARAAFVVAPRRCQPVALLGELAVICGRVASELCRMDGPADDQAEGPVVARELVKVAETAARVTAQVARAAQAEVCRMGRPPVLAKPLWQFARMTALTSSRAADRLADWIAGWAALIVLSGHDPGSTVLRVTGLVTAVSMAVSSVGRRLLLRFRSPSARPGPRRHGIGNGSERRTWR